MKNTLAYNIIRDGKNIQEKYDFNKAPNKSAAQNITQSVKDSLKKIVFYNKLSDYRKAYKKCKDDIHKIFKTYATMFYILGLENLREDIERNHTYNHLFIKNAIPAIYNHFKEKYGLTKYEVNGSCFYYLVSEYGCDWFLADDEDDNAIIDLDFATEEDSGVYELIYASTWVPGDKENWLNN